MQGIAQTNCKLRTLTHHISFKFKCLWILIVKYVNIVNEISQLNEFAKS